MIDYDDFVRSKRRLEVALAKKFKVSVRTIERIVQREAWSHLL